MRTLIRKNRRTEREVTEWLTVIDEFDELVAGQAPLERFVDAAVRLSGRPVGIFDALNGRLAEGRPDEPAAIATMAQTDDHQLVKVLTQVRLRARDTGIVDGPDGEVLAASVDDAGGRIGLAWLGAADRRWAPVDELVVQRLAAAAAINSVRLKDFRATRSRFDYAAVEQLLSQPMAIESAAEAIRRAGLRAGRRYLAIAARAQPGSEVGPDALGQLIARGIERHGLAVRPAVIGLAAALVVEAGATIEQSLTDSIESVGRLGMAIEIGAGEAGDAADLHSSWRQASQALVLRPVLSPTSPVTHFRELGVLHLLAEIPTDDLARYRDVVRLAELDRSAGPVSDLDLLERYLGTMSLRQTAQVLPLHYTTVQYRLKRIETRLGIDLGDSPTRLRTQIAILLYRIERAQTLARGS